MPNRLTSWQPALLKLVHYHQITIIIDWRVVCVLTTYSKTKVSDVFVWMMSWSVTMFVCLSSLRRDASRMAVKGAPSSSWSRISFSATIWLVKLKGWNRIHICVIDKQGCANRDFPPNQQKSSYHVLFITRQKKAPFRGWILPCQCHP